MAGNMVSFLSLLFLVSILSISVVQSEGIPVSSSEVSLGWFPGQFAAWMLDGWLDWIQWIGSWLDWLAVTWLAGVCPKIPIPSQTDREVLWRSFKDALG